MQILCISFHFHHVPVYSVTSLICLWCRAEPSSHSNTHHVVWTESWGLEVQQTADAKLVIHILSRSQICIGHQRYAHVTACPPPVHSKRGWARPKLSPLLCQTDFRPDCHKHHHHRSDVIHSTNAAWARPKLCADWPGGTLTTDRRGFQRQNRCSGQPEGRECLCLPRSRGSQEWRERFSQPL